MGDAIKTSPTVLYIDYANYGVTSWDSLTPSARRFVCELELDTGVPVTLIGTGQTDNNIVDLRNDASCR